MNRVLVFLCVLLAGCGTMSASRQGLLGPLPLENPPADRTGYTASKGAAQTDYVVQPPKDASPPEITRYVHEAEALSINECENWFDLVGKQEISGAVGIQQFNVWNSAATAAAGLAIVDPATAAVTAGALGIVGGLVNGLSDIQLKALLAGSTFTVRDAVLDSMDQYIAMLEPQVPDLSYPLAQIKMRRLEELCRPAAIQNLVNQSINATTSVATPRGVRREARKAASD